MPEIGRPATLQEQRFQDVTIAPKRQNQNIDESDGREKERLLNKISGFKPKNDLYVDGKEHNKMGKDEFLKLLTHQLQNQDPFNPMDQGKMAGELAQFSQLEQLSNLNSKFDKMGGDATVKGKFYGASFLGKEVVTNGSSLSYEGEGNDADILFTLPTQASKAMVRIFDKSNNIVGEVWKENLGRGNQTITWDGIGLDGSIQSAGEYRVDVKAWDQYADPIEVATKVKGEVNSVFFENGETILLVDGKKVFLRDVDSFHNQGESKKITHKQEDNTSHALAGVEVKEAARSGSEKLPIAQNDQKDLNLNKAINKPVQNVSTGLTSVYDVE